MIIGGIARAVFKLLLPEVIERIAPLRKYVDEDNELDIKCRELEQKITDQGFRITVLTDMVKARDEIIDKMEDMFKKLKNTKAFKKSLAE